MDWNLDDIPTLQGKTIIVTGGSSGLGFEAVKMFASKDAEIIIATRSEGRALDAIEKIKLEYKDANVDFIHLNLANKNSIREFANEFNKKYTKIDVLLNNAGVMTTPYMLTDDGFEFQQGINHFGHFYLTSLLLKTIVATPNSRIVNVSSIAHRYGKMDFDNLLYEAPKSYNKSRAYGRSKLENLLFTYELDRRIKEKGYDVKVLVAHPGVASTNLGRHIKQQKAWSKSIKIFQKLFSHTAKDGALPLVRACLDANALSGEFYGPNRLFGVKGKPHKAKSNKLSHNRELQTKLWNYSEELIGIRFDV